MIDDDTPLAAAMRRVDVTDAAQVRADVAVTQSIGAPILSARAELDILIRSNKAALERNQQEAAALAARHKAHIDALNAENDAAIARLVAIGEQIASIIEVLELTNRELSK